MATVQIHDLLPLVEKPSRYLGREINSVHKPPGEIVARAALVFPDLYEVGMSHLGTLLLYGLGNQVQGASVERVFLPGEDLQSLLKQRGAPLFTLESRTPLSECDLLGFTLQSELTYTNILSVLESGGLPLRSAQRSSGPVVLGGGPCAFNPEPLCDFFDLFFLGEAESAWPVMLKEVVRIRRGGGGRDEILEALRGIEGVYDPSAFSVTLNSDGTVARIEPAPGQAGVRKAPVPDLSVTVPPSAWLVPFLQVVHDRLNVEVSRGCTRGCRFCAAGIVYRPVRERSASSVLALVEEALIHTGYEDLALTSLSVGDYGPLDELLCRLMDRYEGERVSVSLPSMRIGSLTPEVARQVQRVRRTGFTIAPEAGTLRLRRVINKDFSDEEILRTAGWVFGQGWEAVKLYFMIGLPTETDEDLEGIVSLSRRIADLAPSNGKVTVNVSPFVPKAHTPFQWVAQEDEGELRRRLSFLQGRLRGRKIQVRWGRTDQAVLEALLSRGDRRLGRVIEAAWRAGAGRDGWEERFRWDAWADALRECGIDEAFYTRRERRLGEVLPWDHLSCGVSRAFLEQEYERGLEGKVTPDCREAGCRDCGVCTKEQILSLLPLRPGEVKEGSDSPREAAPEPAERPVRRVRLLFEKAGDMKFIGHLETLRVFERAARRAGVPLAFSGGFSPKPRINFALSLPLGVEGLAELVDLELTASMPADELMEGINAHMPEGMRVLGAWKTSLDGPTLNSRVRSMTYEISLPTPKPELESMVSRFLARGSLVFKRERKGKQREIDLRDYLLDMSVSEGGNLRLTLALKGEEGSVRPQEVLELFLGRPVGPGEQIPVVRTALHLALELQRPGTRGAMARVWD